MKTTCTSIMFCLCLISAGWLRAEPESTRAACSDGRDNDGDGHVDCADQDCQDLAVCAPTLPGAIDEVARLRSRGTMRVVVGAVLLSLGLVVGGSSAALWIAGNGGSTFSYNTDQQAAVFDSLAQGGEKITASKVKAKRQEVHEKTGEGGPVPRTMKQLRAFLECKTGPADPGHRLAADLRDYLAGEKSEAEMGEAWDLAFSGQVVQRKTG